MVGELICITCIPIMNSKDFSANEVILFIIVSTTNY